MRITFMGFNQFFSQLQKFASIKRTQTRGGFFFYFFFFVNAVAALLRYTESDGSIVYKRFLIKMFSRKVLFAFCRTHTHNIKGM